MDFNKLRYSHQPSLKRVDASITEEQRQAHTQFVRDYALRIRIVRNNLGGGRAVCGFPT